VFFNKLSLPSEENALPGRDTEMPLENVHYVHGRPMKGAFDEQGYHTVYFGLGCFWGAERKFWSLPGVYTTAVGYGAGFTENPTYQEVCSGQTGHNELVLVVYDPNVITFEELLVTFFESHNPTQGMRQGNDKGTQYRSGIYYHSQAQKVSAEKAIESYQASLNKALSQPALITTEVIEAKNFYYAEQYHQQYLAKNPNGYCGLGGTGVSCTL